MSSDDSTAPGTSAGGGSENSADALTLLTQGKRHLLVKDYLEAVGSLGQACGLLAAKFGETADECGEAYLYYGKALLELARAESGVLGDAIEGEGSGEESEEDGNSEENGKDKEEEEEEEKSEGNESADAEKEDEKKEEQQKDDSESTAPTCTDENEPEEGEEDISNLKLAWEMLELAKIIFQRQAKDTQMSLKLAEVYLNLGEVSLESETYEQAIQDLQNCLKIQKEHLQADNRRIAETYYSLGVAYGLNNEFDESMNHYINSLELLELRIKNLKTKKASGDKPDESDAFYTIEGEIEELKEILPEIREKIAELKETKAETIKAVSEMLKEGSEGGSKNNGNAAKTGPTKPVTNISHLIRKKQKNDESTSTSTGNENKNDTVQIQSSNSDESIPAKIQKSE